MQVEVCVSLRDSGVTDGEAGANAPLGSSDVGSFLEMGPLNSSFAT